MIHSISSAPIAAHPAINEPNVKNDKMHFVPDKMPSKKCSHQACTRIFKHIKKILSFLLKKIRECFNRVHPKKKAEAEKPVGKLIPNQANDKKPTLENPPIEPFHFELLPKELQKALIGDFFCGQSLLNFSQTNKDFHQQVTTEFQDNLEIAKLEREAFFKWQEYIGQLDEYGVGEQSRDPIFTPTLMSSYENEIVSLENILKVLPYTDLIKCTPFPRKALLILIQTFKKIYPEQCESLKQLLIKEIQSEKEKKRSTYKALAPLIEALLALDPSQLFQLQDELGFHDANYIDYFPEYIKEIIPLARDEYLEPTLDFVNSIPNSTLKVRGLTELLPVCHRLEKDKAALFIQDARNFATNKGLMKSKFIENLFFAYLRLEDWENACQVIQYAKRKPKLLANCLTTINKNLNWNKEQLDLFLKKILSHFGEGDEVISIAIAYAYCAIDQKVAKKMIEMMDVNAIESQNILTLAKIYVHLSDIDKVKKTIERIEELYPLNSKENPDINIARETKRARYLLEITDILKDTHPDFTREIWNHHIYSFLKHSFGLGWYERSLFRQQAEVFPSDVQKALKTYDKTLEECFSRILDGENSFFWMRIFALIDEDKAKTFIQTQKVRGLQHPLAYASALLGMADAIRFRKTHKPKGVEESAL